MRKGDLILMHQSAYVWAAFTSEWSCSRGDDLWGNFGWLMERVEEPGFEAIDRWGLLVKM